jgi:hypothetical protein
LAFLDQFSNATYAVNVHADNLPNLMLPDAREQELHNHQVA